MYEHYHHDDIPFLAESHKTVLQSQERITTQVKIFIIAQLFSKII